MTVRLWRLLNIADVELPAFVNHLEKELARHQLTIVGSQTTRGESNPDNFCAQVKLEIASRKEQSYDRAERDAHWAVDRAMQACWDARKKK